MGFEDLRRPGRDLAKKFKSRSGQRFVISPRVLHDGRHMALVVNDQTYLVEQRRQSLHQTIRDCRRRSYLDNPLSQFPLFIVNK